LRRRVTELAGQCRVIVTGDFNAGEDSPPYHALFGAEGNHASPLRDAYRLLHPARAADEGTFSNFKAGAVNGPRIDWIGLSADWQALEATIDRTERGGRTPSDHFAVTAILRPDNAPAGRKAASSSKRSAVISVYSVFSLAFQRRTYEEDDTRSAGGVRCAVNARPARNQGSNAW